MFAHRILANKTLEVAPQNFRAFVRAMTPHRPKIDLIQNKLNIKRLDEVFLLKQCFTFCLFRFFFGGDSGDDAGGGALAKSGGDAGAGGSATGGGDDATSAGTATGEGAARAGGAEAAGGGADAACGKGPATGRSARATGPAPISSLDGAVAAIICCTSANCR